MLKRHSSHINGDIAEARFLYDASVREWQVCLPASSSLAYDFAVKRNDTEGWMKVQVKSAYKEIKKREKQKQESRLTACLKTGRKEGYTKESFDLLYVFSKDIDVAWIFPWKDLKNKKEIIVSSPKYRKYQI